MTYLHWLTLFVWSPLLILWAFNGKYLWRYKRTFLFTVISSLILSIPWDLWAVKTQIWAFPSETNSGILLGGLPLEEYGFIVFATLLISTITLVFRKKLNYL